MQEFAKEVLSVDIKDELQKSYLDYAISVIIGRALPDARDGMKPVHRRILFAMHKLSNTYNKPYKKSARVVGDVIGKYHPHGDSAVYDAIVRMTQNFSLRYPLIEGQGNFGSIDGDSAAAMRYTEIRMEKITDQILADIEKETVTYSPNYDGTEDIPDVLPTRIPNLLINGSSGIAVGMGVTQAISTVLPGAGSTSSLDGHLKGVVTEVDGTNAYVKVVSHVSAAGTETNVDYQPGGVYAFAGSGTVAIHTAGQSVSYATTAVTAQADWYDQQTISLSGSTVYWNTLADRPGTSSYAAGRESRFDELHVAVFDDDGSLTGNAGTVLEKHLSLSKAKDAEYSLGSTAYWRKYLANNSAYVFGGSEPSGTVAADHSTGSTFTLATDTGWDQNASGILFAVNGASTLSMSGGKNYDGGTDLTASGSLTSSLAKIASGYDLYENTDNYDIDFLLMGSANYDKETAQALANKLIAVAEARQDALAFISPYRLAFLNDGTAGSVTVNSDADITDNLVSFYAPITSSTYAVFDSGYKYMYDRFADTFRYVPLNGDVAGTCARNDLNNFPWFSPAGTARGAILNAVKLAYNPSKVQRDKLYSNRINPVIFSPGDGIILFGDKTGFGKASAFDRINVRRLFLYLEKAIAAAARDQLFEFNDEITRTNFVNIIEPFLRDVQSKRGIFDYVVICDETNNTAAVIDNNEFVADVFVKPNRSINFIGLTFVATRTGVSFEEVIGNV